MGKTEPSLAAHATMGVFILMGLVAANPCSRAIADETTGVPRRPNIHAGDPAMDLDRTRMRRRLIAELIRTGDPRVDVDGYVSRSIGGWPVRVSEQLMKQDRTRTLKALEILADQLAKVVDVLPDEPLAFAQTVPIWISPTYDGFRPKAEYHGGIGWLRKEGRHPELHQCIELSNVSIIEREVQRMPMMVLHELAHAYHDLVLSVDHAEIRGRYESAKRGGTYDSVQRHNGNFEKAYAMVNRMEYFAETTEAFFGQNDFFPFNQAELKRHDPAMHDVLSRVWGVDDAARN